MSRTVTLTGTVLVMDRRIAYRLLRTPRRRHVHLCIAEDAVVQVRAPCRFSIGAAEAAIRAHSKWVIQTLRRVQDEAFLHPGPVPGACMPLLDERLRLEFAAGSRPVVVRHEDVLRVRGSAQDREASRRALQAWYRNQARAHLTTRLQVFADRVGVRPGRVTIRGQKTRWGSCSGTGTVSLNWRLMLLPCDLVDYVVAHEVCHLRHLNHSARFWALVSDLIPDVADRRGRLRRIQFPRWL